MAPGVPAAVTVTVGAVEVTGCPPIAAVMVLVPAVVPVNVAVYVPSALSVTVENVPWPVPVPSPNATVAPPVVRAVPLASRAVRVTVLVPPTATEAGEMATVDRELLIGPGAAAALHVALPIFEVTGCPPIVAVMVLVPAVVPVNVAVYVPSALSVT